MPLKLYTQGHSRVLTVYVAVRWSTSEELWAAFSHSEMVGCILGVEITAAPPVPAEPASVNATSKDGLLYKMR